jgi:hypothetical protein
MSVPVSIIILIFCTQNIFSDLVSASGMMCHYNFPDAIPEFST